MNEVLTTKALKKTFRTKGSAVEAVRGVDLRITEGEIFGFLGPNGAGKTTTLRMVATLMKPDSGEATIAGYDLFRQSAEIRKNIGYVSQAGGSDRDVTAREDLILQGRLYGMSKQAAQKQAEKLIDALDISSVADRKAATYSGGQKRRLDIALGMMHHPKLLFLDEPTTGLDPQNRERLWDLVRELRDDGVTIFLTTHYMDEADALSDRVAIMDKGIIVAEGTPKELKQKVSGDMILIGIAHALHEKALQVLQQQSYVRETSSENNAVRLYVDSGERVLPDIMRLLDSEKIPMHTITLSQPTLNDVFLKQTGRKLHEEEA